MEHRISASVFQFKEEVRALYLQYEEELKKYTDQLLWWNNRVNLVSRDVSRETIKLHVQHSLVISQSELFKKASKIVDAGTGGGLPGIPLSITHPQKEILLNDIVSKKMMACKQIILKLGLGNASTRDASIAEIDLANDDLIITKHAFKINDLIELLGEREWGGIILLKGEKEVGQELKGLHMPLDVHIISLQVFDNSFYNGKALVEITKK